MGSSNSILSDSFNETHLSKKKISEEFFKQNYKLISPIDCGAFGQVLKYEFKNQYYAVKEVKFNENGPIKLNDLKNEILILQYVSNLEPKLPYFVKYFGFSLFSSNKIAIVYELADGNLLDLANSKFNNLEKKLLYLEYINLLVCLVKALAFLELHNIAHRDLKPQNVLYRICKEQNQIKLMYILCDFGISKLCDLGSQNFNTTAGSPIFMSPEVTFNFYNQIEKANSNPFKSDVYSLGLLLLKVIVNKNLTLKDRIMEKDYDPNIFDLGPNETNINSMIEEVYDLLLMLSEDIYTINKFKIILKSMLMYSTKTRPDMFGIYCLLINMGFIKNNYEEIEKWINHKKTKQISFLMRQNETLAELNIKLKAENEKLVKLNQHNPNELLFFKKIDFFDDSNLNNQNKIIKNTSDQNLIKHYDNKFNHSISEKSFINLEKFFSISSSANSSSNIYDRKLIELSLPAAGFKISEYKGELKKIKNYNIFSNLKIGRGSFGDIFLGSDNLETALYAIKERKLNNKFASTKEKFYELVKREITNATILNFHPNVVNFIDIVQEENEIYVIWEYCPDGSLSYLLQKSGGKLEETQVWRIFKDILEGFKFLHENNIIHRNLKPSSILLHNEAAKISGFYFSKQVFDADKKELMTSFGTPQYMAPEIFESKEYCSKCDVWSLGITLFEMLYGEFPWKGKNTRDLIENNIKKKILWFPETSTVSKKMKDLMSRMLIFDQDQRISWNELFKLELD